MALPEVYLDMDGVLADFFTEYAKLAGVQNGSYRDIPPAKVDPTLDKMIGTDFFARLPMFPTATQLVAMTVKQFGKYHICSSPLRGDFKNSEHYKRVWIQQHLKPQPTDIIITPNKAKYATQADGTPNILIDDRGSNISSWEAAGGIGIKYQADEDDLSKVAQGFARAMKIVGGEQAHEPQKLSSLDRGKMIAVDKSGDSDEAHENMDHTKDTQAVPELKSALTAHKKEIQKASDDQVYDIIDKMMTRIAKSHGISGQKLHDMWVKKYGQIPDTWVMKISEDWNKVNHHDHTDGLSHKAVSAYRREHPGSHLQTAVTTKPSKLKKGSKSSKRRASFCARMSGMKKHRAGAKTKRDPDSPINKALRRWHCESIEEMQELIMLGEAYIANLKQETLTEKWSQKYKSSINCSHPKGFSQKAHCQGKKKHNEDMTMESVCPDCGMCQTHGSLNEIAKGAKDSNGYTKCWPGKHAEGTKKGKNGGQVRNCVPNESKIYEQVGTFSSSNMQMSVDGARHLAQVDLARKKYGDKETPAGFAKDWNPEVKTIADPKNPGKYQSTVTLKPKDYPLSPNLIARPSMDPNQDFDYFHKGEQMMPDHPLYNRVKQTHLDSMRAPVEPDVSNENFADGKGPGRPGDSKRNGISKGISLSNLDKITHSSTASPRKKQLAHWQANMRRGKNK